MGGFTMERERENDEGSAEQKNAWVESEGVDEEGNRVKYYTFRCEDVDTAALAAPTSGNEPVSPATLDKAAARQARRRYYRELRKLAEEVFAALTDGFANGFTLDEITRRPPFSAEPAEVLELIKTESVYDGEGRLVKDVWHYGTIK
jgi:hypothetical protein